MATIDFQFRLQGDRIHADHGYLLYSAVSEIAEKLHGDEQIGIHAISGRLLRDRTLALTEKSRLTIRLPAERVVDVLKLAGKTLVIGEYRIAVGVPESLALVPAARLYSRLVVIKGFMEPYPFLAAARRQLAELEVKAEPSLVSTAETAQANEGHVGGTHSPWLRRTLRIHGKEIVGFALRVEGLTAEESLLLQEKGLGGRRRFGCGVFVVAVR